MAGPRKVTQEEYDKIRSSLEDKYHYDEMSDEKKAMFDSEIDKTITVEDKPEDTDDEEVEKGEFEDGHPQERDDDEDIR